MAIVQVYLFVKASGMDTHDDGLMVKLGFGAIFLWMLSAWALYAMSYKRLHDIGYPGKFAVLIFVPFISLLFLFAMMVIPGSQQTNEYGPPPFAKE